MPHYKSKKVNIKTVIKDKGNITSINDIVNICHTVRMLTTHILKLYILHVRSTGILIQINCILKEKCIVSLMEVICDMNQIINDSVKSALKLLQDERMGKRKRLKSSLLHDYVLSKNSNESDIKKGWIAFMREEVIIKIW